MYMDWPQQVLSHPGFEEVLNPVTRQPLFRGPRLRMGLSEGQPSSVLPDHNGRANYHGGSINRAARFMDAAAQGGQVVTSIDLVRRIFMCWRCLDDQHHQQQQQHQDGTQCGSSSLVEKEEELQLQLQCGAAAANEEPSDVSMVADGSVSDQRQSAGRQHSGGSGSGVQPGPLPVPALTIHAQQGVAGTDALALEESGSGSLHAAGVMMPLPPLVGLGARAAGGSNGGGKAACQQRTSPAPVLEPVSAVHLGRFVFKGLSGECDMAHITHAQLAERTFSEERPSGKGVRIPGLQSSGPVMDLPAVQLALPRRLVAARDNNPKP